jgi:hypothetical protein
VDNETSTLVGIPTDVEREVIAATGSQNLYVSPNDVIVPKERQMETMDDGRKRFVGLISRSRRRPVHAYIIRSIEETSSTTVKVNWMVYSGPLNAHGGSVVLVLVNGQWTAQEIEMEWLS